MQPQDFYNSNGDIDKIDDKLNKNLAAYNQYANKLKNNGIIFHIINPMIQCKYVQIQKSALGDYVKYSVSYGYIELTLSVYIVQLGAKHTAKFKNLRSQINGIQYQVLPFHPVLYKYYICRAAQSKILAILFGQENGQGKIKDKNKRQRQRFDLIINSEYDFCFIPSITLPVSSLKILSKASDSMLGFMKKDYDEKYLVILGKLEFYLSKVLHFMNILGITNYLSFILVDKNIAHQVITNQYRIQQKQLEIYITAVFSSNFIYQEDFINNFLNPQTYILSINQTNFKYDVHTPRHPTMNFNKLSQIYLSSTFDLLAEFYLGKDTAKMVKLCTDNKWSQLIQGNKNLVIGLLSWLYEIIEHKKYLEISQVLLTASKIRLQSSGMSTKEHIINCNKIVGDKQNQSLGLKHKKQQSNTKDMGWKKKKNIGSQIGEDESSDIDSCQQISEKMAMSQHSEFDQQKISQFQDSQMDTKLEQKNCNYLLGQQHEYLLDKKYCKLSNKINKNSKIFQQQKKRVFQTEFVHLVYRNIQASKYKDLYISVKQSINLRQICEIRSQDIIENAEDIANKIQIINQLSIFLVVEPISTILNFVRHQSGCSQKVDIQDDINFLMVQTQVLIKKCQQNGLRLVQCIGNKILSRREKGMSCNPQIQVIKGWQLLIQILMIHIRYENSIPTLFSQLDKQYEKLWGISQQFILSCKSDLKKQKQPKIEHLLVYCLWVTYDNILVRIKVLTKNTHYLRFPTWAWQMASSNLSNNKQLKFMLRINKNESIQYNILCQIFRMIIEFEDLYLKMQLLYQIGINEEYRNICDCALPDHLINTLSVIQQLQTFLVKNYSGSEFFGFVCASYDYLKIFTSHAIQKTGQTISPFSIHNTKFVFLAKYTIFSKQTLNWICKYSSYLQDILPDTAINMIYLQECAQFFKNPALQLVYFKYDRYKDPHPTFRAEKFEHIIDSLKAYVSSLQNKGQNLSYFSLIAVTILITFAFNDSHFYQYKLEIQLILKEMLQISIKHPTEQTNIFIKLILPTLNRMKSYPEVLNLALKICYNQIQIIQQQTKKLKQNQLMMKHYQQIEIKQNSFRDDFNNKYSQWFIAQYQLENKQQNNSFKYLAHYFALKKIVQWLNELNKKIYLLAKSVEQDHIASFQIKFYEILVETKLRFCWNTSQNIKYYCKFMNVLLPAKQILQNAQQYYDYKDLKKDRQLSFNNFLVFLDKHALQQSKQWLTDLQERYCSSIKFNKNQESYLLPYIHKIGYKYYDDLSDGRLKTNEYILFIGVEYLKHHKQEISKIEQNWKLLQQICMAFFQHYEKYLKPRANYVIANLHYITAELSQIKNDWKKSKIHYKRMEKYQKFNNQARFKFLPIINFYHKIHKMFEKFANETSNFFKYKKKIYRVVCPICPTAQNKNFQFTKPFQKIAEKIKRRQNILSSQTSKAC